MQVQDLMSEPVITCRPDDTLKEAARLMWERACGVLVVVDDAGSLVGVITDRDIAMGALHQDRLLAEIAVDDIMEGASLLTCRTDDDVNTVLGLMIANKVRRVPVVDEGRVVVGLLSVDDVAAVAQRSQDGAPDVDAAAVAALLSTTVHPSASPPR